MTSRQDLLGIAKPITYTQFWGKNYFFKTFHVQYVVRTLDSRRNCNSSMQLNRLMVEDGKLMSYLE